MSRQYLFFLDANKTIVVISFMSHRDFFTRSWKEFNLVYESLRCFL